MTKRSAPEGFYTISEVSEMLCVHRNTVQRWIADSKISYVKPASSYLIPETEITRLMTPHTATAAPTE